MEVVLEKGRPKNNNGRLEKEIRVYDFLDKIGIEYYRSDHKSVGSMEECSKVDRKLDVRISKNLFLCNRQKTRYYILMMPGDKSFKTRELSAQINSSRLSFAPEEDMLKFLDITPGSVSIMGLMNDKENKVQLLIDREVLSQEYIGCHPCINTSSLKIKTSDIIENYLNKVNHNYIEVNLKGE